MDVPFDTKPVPKKIVVDLKNESIILPIEGQFVPFLIRSIKQITKSDDDGENILHSFRVWFCIFSTRFECNFHIFYTRFECKFTHFSKVKFPIFV